MSKLKTIFIVLLSLYLGWLLFGGILFRQIVSYKPLHERNYSSFNNKLSTDEKLTNPEEIINESLSITSDKLNFTFTKCDHDPNKLLQSHKANCIGYAIFFSATCNQLFEKNGIKDWRAVPMVAKISILGINVHKYISSPFFKDHDFVKIENSKTGEIIYVDPGLYDYTGIEIVTGE